MNTSYQGGVLDEDYDEFQSLSTTIGSNIKKISQNGNIFFVLIC